MKPPLFLISPPKKISWAGHTAAVSEPTALLLVCGGVRATSDCISTNTHWIPQIHKTLAGRKEIKVWKHSCVLGSPVRAPKHINHRFRGGGSAGSFMLQSDDKKKVLCSVWLKKNQSNENVFGSGLPLYSLVYIKSHTSKLKFTRLKSCNQ